ncbi:MAG: hypothetical protein K0S32_3560 [Bacteroidetes bacterium]|jgi:hypothetical protein|nr:hypothetical protein [Bacteroidota bacterium]
MEVIPPVKDSAVIKTVSDTAKTVLENPEQKETGSVTGIEFAFCNEAGTQLLALADSLADPSSLTKSFSDERKLIPVSFVKKRIADKEDNGRQTYYNFEKCGGYFFETTSGKVSHDSSNVLLSEKFLKERKLVSLVPNNSTNIPGPLRMRIEQSKARKIKKFKCLGQIDNASCFYIIEFERKKDSCLAALVYINKEKFVWLNFPAKYNDISVWRVDDGGEFGVDYYNLLTVFEYKGIIEIVVDWIGAEGFSIEFLREKGNEFKSMKGSYRYAAPL